MGGPRNLHRIGLREALEVTVHSRAHPLRSSDEHTVDVLWGGLAMGNQLWILPCCLERIGQEESVMPPFLMALRPFPNNNR